MFAAGAIREMNPGRVNAVLPVGALVLALFPSVLTSSIAFAETRNFAYLLRLFGATAFNFIFFSVLLMAISHVPWRPVRAAAYAGLWLFLALYTIVSIYHLCLFGQLVGLSSIMAILDTNRRETFEFLLTVLRPDFVIFSLLAAVPLLYGFKYVFAKASKQRPDAIAALAYAAIFLAVAFTGLQRPLLRFNNPVLFFLHGIEESLDQKQKFLAIRAALQDKMPGTSLTQTAGTALHVLVIGEATTRRHMSLYGYSRATSPNLTALRDLLYVATDACSSHGSTIPALQELLTFATRGDHAPLFNTPNLIEIMKSAGFKTFWLSNQQSTSHADSWSSMFSDSADVRAFVNKRGWADGISYDDKLLEPFNQALADPAPKKFIVVHLLGSHAAYAMRYPSQFEKFVTAEGVDPRVRAKGYSFFDKLLPKSGVAQYNAYDNSLLYNDFIMSTLIASVTNFDPASLTYISDHGEALYETSDFIGHVDGPAPRQVYEIPLLFYLSEGMKLTLGDRLRIFRHNLKKPFQSDYMMRSLLDLYQIPYPRVRTNDSLFDERFAVGARYCDKLGGDDPLAVSAAPDSPM